MARKAGYAVATVLQPVGGHVYRLRTLRDRQQFSDPHGEAERAGIYSAAWPIFGVLWPVGLALAEEMARLPVAGKHVLEVGCGIGLSSLVLQRRGANITATDHHPLAEEFLRFNADANGLPRVKFSLGAWAGPNPGLGRFDVIVGADLLYERGHPELLARFICEHAEPQSQVVIADPARRQAGEFIKLMGAKGYALRERAFQFPDGAGRSCRGRMLDFIR